MSREPKIGVRQSTRRKFDRVSRSTRLKLVDVADLAIDLLIEARKKEKDRPAMAQAGQA
jgi:hypothetical protein